MPFRRSASEVSNLQSMRSHVSLHVRNVKTSEIQSLSSKPPVSVFLTKSIQGFAIQDETRDFIGLHKNSNYIIWALVG